jgi:hypothetical protein
VQELLLDKSGPNDTAVLRCWSVDEIVVRGGLAYILLELSKEEVGTTSLVPLSLNRGRALVSTQLFPPLLLLLVGGRSGTDPGLAVKEAKESLFKFDLPSNADVLKEKRVDDLRISEGPKKDVNEEIIGRSFRIYLYFPFR